MDPDDDPRPTPRAPAEEKRSADPDDPSDFVPVYDRILWSQSERRLARDGLTRAADAS